jgi:hypothetical protein
MKKYIRSAALILLISVLAALTLASCGKCKHAKTDWRVDIEPTCLLAGTRTKVCEECGEEIETEQYPGNHIFDEGACTYCGIPQYDTRYLQYRPITINGEEGYEVVDMGNCSQYNLKLPAIHNNKPVLAIAPGAFENRVKLKSVHISQNIAVIGDAAFAGCKALEAVTFAEESELLSFGSGVFLNCALIERIAIPAGVTTLSDGLFEVLLIKGIKNAVDLAETAKLLLQKKTDGDRVTLLHTSKVHIECEEAPAWCTDGEFAGNYSSVDAECLHGAVRILI